MRIGEGPQWKVVRFDGLTGRGVVRGVVELPFESEVPDFLDSEPVFVSLRDVETVKAVWPLVAHLPLAVDDALRAEAEVLPPPLWGPTVDAVVGALPVPFEAVAAPGPSFVGVETTRNEYVPWGVDVHVGGALELVGVRHQTGPFPAGGLALRRATPLERAWAARQGWGSSLALLALAHAASPTGPGRAPLPPVLCAVDEVRWRSHAASVTAVLDRALLAWWTGAPPLGVANEHGRVSVRFATGEATLGEVEAAHAERWVVAMNEVLSTLE